MNRDSRLYRELTGEELTRIAEKHFGVGAPASAELLSGGLFNPIGGGKLASRAHRNGRRA